MIRHGRSTANDAEVPSGMTAEGLAFANKHAELTPKGEGQCDQLATVLPVDYKVDAYNTCVATSEYVRAQQTTRRLGFRESLTTYYPQLNEVDHGMEVDTLRAMLGQNKIPSIAIQAAEEALRQPPTEGVWVSHGLLIAGMCIVLGTIDQFDRPVPYQCEVRRLTF